MLITGVSTYVVVFEKVRTISFVEYSVALLRPKQRTLVRGPIMASPIQKDARS